jgi:hypothetical protein
VEEVAGGTYGPPSARPSTACVDSPRGPLTRSAGVEGYPSASARDAEVSAAGFSPSGTLQRPSLGGRKCDKPLRRNPPSASSRRT